MRVAWRTAQVKVPESSNISREIKGSLLFRLSRNSTSFIDGWLRPGYHESDAEVTEIFRKDPVPREQVSGTTAPVLDDLFEGYW